jgi:propionyl-CoA carboxylase alpha chain
MLAKVIVHGDTRDEAALRLATVLERLQVHGVTTNRDFLVHVLRHPAFLEGDTTTDFIDRYDPEREHVPPHADVRAAALAAALVAQDARRKAARMLATIPSGWRNNPAIPQQARYLHRGEPVSVCYQPRRDGSVTWSIDGDEGVARLWGVNDSTADVEVDGVRRLLQITTDGDRTWVQTTRGEVLLVEIPRFPVREAEAVAGGYAAPMPGKIVRVDASPGQRVTKGQVLLILEAMKMEHRIMATSDGTVAEVRVHEGQQVDARQVLVVVEAEE